jgi:large subunit ribosomal protein L37Ae
MGKTKKVGVAGRFGTRYGVSLRRRTKEIEEGVRSAHTCPSCNQKKVKRVSTGVWECKKCGLKFAGGAYLPTVAREGST